VGVLVAVALLYAFIGSLRIRRGRVRASDHARTHCGFLLAALAPLVGSTIVALLISSFLFGMLHAYQHPFGVARAAILGVALGIPYLVSGTILPSMLSHTLIDVIGGLWLVRRIS